MANQAKTNNYVIPKLHLNHPACPVLLYMFTAGAQAPAVMSDRNVGIWVTTFPLDFAWFVLNAPPSLSLSPWLSHLARH